MSARTTTLALAMGALATAGLLLAFGGRPAGAEPPAVASAGRPVIEDAVPPRPGVGERLDEIRRRVQQALDYPPIARWHELTGESVVRFEIGPDGRARAVNVVRSSGLALLDQAAAQAVAAAGVLPRVYGPLEIPVRFELE